MLLLCLEVKETLEIIWGYGGDRTTLHEKIWGPEDQTHIATHAPEKEGRSSALKSVLTC